MGKLKIKKKDQRKSNAKSQCFPVGFIVLF